MTIKNCFAIADDVEMDVTGSYNMTDLIMEIGSIITQDLENFKLWKMPL
jgi:hypothetical protein